VSSIEASSRAPAAAVDADVNGPSSMMLNDERLRARNCEDGARIVFRLQSRDRVAIGRETQAEGKVADVERQAPKRRILFFLFEIGKADGVTSERSSRRCN